AAVVGGAACAAATSSPAPSPSAIPAPVATAAPAAAPSGETTIVAAAWMGNKTRKLYYLAGCPATKLIAPADTISFRTATEAKAAGFTRAIVPDC
ncbi:MAG: hypothetical protein MUF53_09300, partial [Gemmatimonadaceae bacterium]|nr:hypothetical protein [Gemmatimonadaceae bacterium]